MFRCITCLCCIHETCIYTLEWISIFHGIRIIASGHRTLARVSQAGLKNPWSFMKSLGNPSLPLNSFLRELTEKKFLRGGREGRQGTRYWNEKVLWPLELGKKYVSVFRVGEQRNGIRDWLEECFNVDTIVLIYKRIRNVRSYIEKCMIEWG